MLEYIIIEDRNVKELQTKINIHATDGWRLVNMTVEPATQYTQRQYLACLERAMPEMKEL